MHSVVPRVHKEHTTQVTPSSLCTIHLQTVADSPSCKDKSSQKLISDSTIAFMVNLIYIKNPTNDTAWAKFTRLAEKLDC